MNYSKHKRELRLVEQPWEELVKIWIIHLKKTLYAAEKENEEVQLKRVDYWEQIKEIRVEDLIFIDESGVNLAMLRLYAA